MKEKIELLKEKLNKLSDENFKEYSGKEHTADYFLHVGKADAFGEAVDLIDEILS